MNIEELLKYDRISDTILYLGPNVSLDFVVNLASKRKDGSRQFFHSEYEKPSVYRLTDISRTIRRHCRYYYVINVRNNFGAGIVLRHSDVYILTKSIENVVIPWFIGKSRIYSIVDGKLVITGEYEPYMYPQSNYQYISMVPIVYEYENNQFKEGVRMFLSSPDLSVDLTLDDLLGLFHLLKTTDMYNLASSMMNYAKTLPYDINKSRIQGLGSGGDSDDSYLGLYSNRNYNTEKTNNFLDNAKKKGE
jgi:hypothetical protein